MELINRKHYSPLRVFLYGLIIAFLALSPALFRYNGAYITRGDYLEQQLPFLAETQRILRNGLNTYSFNTFLGAPAIGSYAFYTLGSPFVWPLAFLPKSVLPYAISVMAILKHAFCVLTAFLYLRKMVVRTDLAFLGSVLYAFSSFTVVNTQFYHFTEIIACFPLLLLGFEHAMRSTPRPGCLAFFCGLNTLVNYYFMFASTILVFLYILFRFFSPDWKTQHRLRRFLFALFECITGCALAGFLLCPAMLYMLQITRNGRGGNLLQLYSFPNILERLRVLLMPIESNVVHAYYGDAASWTSTAAWLPLFGFSGTACFLSRSHSNDSIWLRQLILTLIIFSFIPLLNGLFVLESNTMYTRWWYGLVLMMVTATLSVLDSVDSSPAIQRHLLQSFIICIAGSVILTFPFLIPRNVLESFFGVLPHQITDVLLNRMGGARAGFPFVVLSLSVTVISSLCFMHHFRNGHLISSSRLTLSAILISILAYAGYIWTGDTFLKSGSEHPVNGLYSLDEIAEPTLSALQLSDCPEYTRMDYGLKLRNYGLLRGASSLTVFHSLRQSITGRFITLAGFGYDESTTIHPPTNSGAIQTFLSVDEYHLTDSTDSVPEGFIYDREENGFAVFTNPNRVPMGFLQTVCTGSYDQPMTPDTIAPTLLAAVALDEPWLTEARKSLATLDVYHIPDWKESAALLQAQSCDTFHTDMHGFYAHINTDKAGYLVFTIPFDKGFTAFVDGQPSQIIPCDISFMAVSLTPGEHNIQFRYHTRGLNLGILVSLTSAIILTLYMYLAHKQYVIICPISETSQGK